MKFTDRNDWSATQGPAWTYSVEAPRRFSPLWLLGLLASYGIPLGGLATLLVASALGAFNA